MPPKPPRKPSKRPAEGSPSPPTPAKKSREMDLMVADSESGILGPMPSTTRSDAETENLLRQRSSRYHPLWDDSGWCLHTREGTRFTEALQKNRARIAAELQLRGLTPIRQRFGESEQHIFDDAILDILQHENRRRRKRAEDVEKIRVEKEGDAMEMVLHPYFGQFWVPKGEAEQYKTATRIREEEGVSTDLSGNKTGSVRKAGVPVRQYLARGGLTMPESETPKEPPPQNLPATVHLSGDGHGGETVPGPPRPQPQIGQQPRRPFTSSGGRGGSLVNNTPSGARGGIAAFGAKNPDMPKTGTDPITPASVLPRQPPKSGAKIIDLSDSEDEKNLVARRGGKTAIGIKGPDKPKGSTAQTAPAHNSRQQTALQQPAPQQPPPKQPPPKQPSTRHDPTPNPPKVDPPVPSNPGRRQPPPTQPHASQTPSKNKPGPTQPVREYINRPMIRLPPPPQVPGRKPVRLQVVSDLHMTSDEDFKNYTIKNVLPKGPYEGPTAGILALLGDIGQVNHPEFFPFLDRHFRHFDTILFVMGETESYGLSREEARDRINSWSTRRGSRRFYQKFQLLDRWFHSEGDVTFLGATLFSELDPDLEEEIIKWNDDFKEIKNWTTKDHNSAFKEDLRFLNYTVWNDAEKNPDTRYVILTHYCPMVDPVAFNGLRWMKYDNRSAEGTDLSGEECWEYPNVKAWVWGHTHCNVDYVDRKTQKRCVTNQAGQLDKPAFGYDSGFILEI